MVSLSPVESSVCTVDVVSIRFGIEGSFDALTVESDAADSFSLKSSAALKDGSFWLLEGGAIVDTCGGNTLEDDGVTRNK